MERSPPDPYRAPQPLRLSICKHMGVAVLLVSQRTNLKEGIRVVVDITLMITTGEMEAVEEEEEGDEVVITEVGTIDQHTGKGTGNRSPPGDTCDTDEADRGVHREAPGAGIFHGGTNVGGVLLVSTHADPQRPHFQLL